MLRQPFLICLLLFTAPGTAPAADVTSGKVSLQFAVNGFKKDGGSYGNAIATDVLTLDGGRYEIRSETVALGFITILKRSSRGTVGDAGLVAEEFRDERKTKTPALARVDRARKVVVFDQGEIREEPLRDPLYDQLSFAYSFFVRPPDSDDYRFFMMDGRRMTDYHYRKIGTEQIDSVLGKLETVHLKKVQEAGDERGADLWLAVAHHYLPVKAVVTEKDGGRLEQVVTKLTF
jgi:hypothetical protein